MRYEIICDECGMELNISKFDSEIVDFKGNAVKVQSFSCPKCDHKFIISVFDKESERLRDEWEALDKDFTELRCMEPGPSKDERARVLIKERNRRKRAMVAHNNRLKQRCLKELRRHGQR